MFCSNCGNKCDDGDIYCGMCGVKILEDDVFGLSDDDLLVEPAKDPFDYFGIQPENTINNTNNNDFGSNHFNQDDNVTVMLDPNEIFPQKYPECSLIYVESNEVIHVTNYPFVIGKDPNKVNYAVKDEPTVSRVHAKLICKDDKIYIVDLNSTNHTFINGDMILSGEEVELRDEDQIFISKVPFIFKM